MSSLNHPLQPFVDRLSALSPLTEQERSILLSVTGKVSQARANADILALGQGAQFVVFVVDGLVGRFGQLRDGKRQITALHLPGDMVDVHSIAAPGVASAIQALCTSTIIRFPIVELRQIAADHAGIARAFWAYSAVDAAILSRWAINIGRKEAVARSAHLLCEIALRMEQAGCGNRRGFTLEATQQQLGDALGLTTVHVNRTLKKLRALQLISVEGRTIHIEDWPGLALIGDFDPQYLQLEGSFKIAA